MVRSIHCANRVKVARFQGLDLPERSSPAHIHVIGSGCEAVFQLNCPKGPVTLRENYGFLRRDIARIKAMLATEVSELCRDLGENPWQGVMNSK